MFPKISGSKEKSKTCALLKMLENPELANRCVLTALPRDEKQKIVVCVTLKTLPGLKPSATATVCAQNKKPLSTKGREFPTFQDKSQ